MNNNILITSAGRRVSLVSYFQKELKKICGEKTKVYTTDLDPFMSSACHISDEGIKVGYFSHKDYINDILKICIDRNIGLIVPTIDTELKLLSINRKRFLDVGINIIISDIDLITKCRDKRLTIDLFKELDIQNPVILDPKEPVFPMFIKPIDGSSSKDLYVITDKSQLNDRLLNTDEFIHMEYLSPENFDEYTLDLYYDINSELKCIVPRRRIAVRGGEVNKGITENGILVQYIKDRMSVLTGARGCITLQLFKHKVDDSKIYGIEINPRFGGGYPLSYLAGANYIKHIIKEYYFNEEVSYYSSWKDKVLLLRYDSEMVLDGSGL